MLMITVLENKMQDTKISNSSAEIISTNQDLLTQILVRLPVKPLLRFKSVSKYWLSLISSPQFSAAHTLRRSPKPVVSGLILRKSPSEFKLLSFNSDSVSGSSLLSLHFLNGLKIIQSCNGLLLCSTLPQVGTKRKYYVSNPTTKQLSALPPLGTDSPSVTIFGFNLAFDPSKSCNYKIICVRSTEFSLYHYQIELYDSEIGAWRLSGSPFVAPFDLVFDNAVFWNGAVHWISPTGRGLYFDVDKELIEAIPYLPSPSSWAKRRFRYIGESGGHLHLIEIYGSGCLKFRVFELKRDYSSWCVRYQVDLDNARTEFPEMVRAYLDPGSNYYAFVVLCVVEEEKEEESSLLLHIPSKVISYSFKDKTLKKVYEFGNNGSSRSKDSLLFGWLDAYQYIESLAPV